MNVTAGDVARPSFVEDVDRIVKGTGLDRERLVVELTETAVIHDLQAAASALRELRELGVGVALDDFGTGYSSMLYLRDLPVSVLKIDREFVRRVTRSGGDHAIVQSTMSLARSLGLLVIAEGVEGQGQARSLSRLGCRLAQGYLYGRPMPIEQLEVWATAQQGWGPAPDLLPVSEMLAEQQARDLRAGGASLCTIAAALNGAGYRTPVGRLWRPASVAILLRANAKLPA